MHTSYPYFVDNQLQFWVFAATGAWKWAIAICVFGPDLGLIFLGCLWLYIKHHSWRENLKKKKWNVSIDHIYVKNAVKSHLFKTIFAFNPLYFIHLKHHIEVALVKSFWNKLLILFFKAKMCLEWNSVLFAVL